MEAIDPAAVSIRIASPADAGELAALRYRFRSELAQPVEDEPAFLARAAPWLAQRLAQPHWCAWVAAAPAGPIIGQIFLQLIEKVPNPVVEAEQIGYITNAYVLPGWRNRGIGARLLGAALAQCLPELVETVILWPSAQSGPLYLRAGFQAPAALLERPARPHPPPEL